MLPRKNPKDSSPRTPPAIPRPHIFRWIAKTPPSRAMREKMIPTAPQTKMMLANDSPPIGRIEAADVPMAMKYPQKMIPRMPAIRSKAPPATGKAERSCIGIIGGGIPYAGGGMGGGGPAIGALMARRIMSLLFKCTEESKTTNAAPASLETRLFRARPPPEDS